MKKLAAWLFSLILIIYFLIVWGGIVRTTGSGLGCPDWPLCHGQWIPPFQKEVLIEYTHRLLASIVGFITLGIVITVWAKKEWRTILGKMCGGAIALLVVQVVLGGITVKSELHPYIVATHLGVALIFFAVVCLMFFKIWLYDSTSVRQYIGNHRTDVPTYRRTFWLSVFTLGILFLQMILGSLVAASHAGLACPDFPMCQGEWLPPLNGLVGLHFFHRVGAFLVTAMVLRLAVVAWKHATVRFVFILTLVQVGLGIGNILLVLPLSMRVLHLAVAVLLYLMLIKSTYELRRNPA